MDGRNRSGGRRVAALSASFGLIALLILLLATVGVAQAEQPLLGPANGGLTA